MKTQSQIFDFGRFTMTLRHDLMLNGKQLLLKFLLMIAAITLIITLLNLPNLNFYPNYESSQLESLGGAFKFLGMLFCALGASLFMDDMKTNGQRLNAIMSPSSQLEKFLSRVTIYIVGVFVAYLICFTLADLIRVGVLRLFYGEVKGLHFVSIFDILETFEYPWMGLLVIPCVQFNFALGSTLWPKNSFLKTFGALMVLQLIISVICSYVFKIVIAGKTITPLVLSEGSGQDILNIFMVVTVIWTVFCIVTTYFRLKESEIINRF